MKNRKLGKYEVLDRLGRGGMAEVYRGYHVNLDRYVAIKVLHSFLSDDPEFKARFEQEAQNIAKLRHPHIVQVYDFEFDEASESYYMVMELIEGPTIRDQLYAKNPERAEPIELGEVIRVIKESAQALSYAHKRGMIHRDVKPANLMLDSRENNRVVLTDFGIAKLMGGNTNTVSGGIVGTPAYMSPEQGMGESGDERSDLYSLGIIMYQMLTGQLPYDADTPVVLLLSHMNEPIPSVRDHNPHLPPAVDKVLQKMMAKEPDDRYQTAEELIENLEILENRPSALDPQTLVLPKVPLNSDAPSRTGAVADKHLTDNGRDWWFWLIPLFFGIIFLFGGYMVLANNGVVPNILAVMATDTPTPTATLTETATLTATATSTDTPTPTDTATSTDTPTPTDTATSTDTPTATVTQTFTPTLDVTDTPTRQNTPTATLNLTATEAVIRTATISACTFDYAIISHNPEDGFEGGFFRTNEEYTREITLLNTGGCAWEPNTSMTWIDGESFNAGPRIFIRERVEPASEVVVLFEGRMPRAGSIDPIVGTWELRTPGQIPIGEPFEISIMVYDPG